MLDKIILFPYYLTLKSRNKSYLSGKKFAAKSIVPTICVGNITVGGTGKTPHTEMILRTILRDRCFEGANVAVLSRGYKRKSRGFQQVAAGGSAAFYGDEPVQIKNKFPSVTVALDKDRVEGCALLCNPEKVYNDKKYRKCCEKDFPKADLIVLDDAFQYRKLQADLNIILVDSYRPLDEDKLLPFGNLRDLPERICEADVIIVTKCHPYMEEEEKVAWAQRLGVKDWSPDTFTGTSADGRTQYVFFTSIRYSAPEPVYPDECDPRYVYSKKVVLFTGIAKDTPLKMYLSDSYKIEESFRFPDHHKYSNSDVYRICGAASKRPTAAIMTTEKDAQRIRDFKKLPHAMREKLFQIPIEVSFLTEEEHFEFVKILRSLKR